MSVGSRTVVKIFSLSCVRASNERVCLGVHDLHAMRFSPLCVLASRDHLLDVNVFVRRERGFDAGFLSEAYVVHATLSRCCLLFVDFCCFCACCIPVCFVAFSFYPFRPYVDG